MIRPARASNPDSPITSGSVYSEAGCQVKLVLINYDNEILSQNMCTILDVTVIIAMLSRTCNMEIQYRKLLYACVNYL